MGASNPRIKTNSLDLPASRLALFLDSSAPRLAGFVALDAHSFHSSAVLSSIFLGCIRLAHVNQSPLSSCLCVARLGRCCGIYTLGGRPSAPGSQALGEINALVSCILPAGVRRDSRWKMAT